MSRLPLEAGAAALVVSPHFDDAVLSAWALLDSTTFTSVDVLTAFGGMPPYQTFTAGDHACGFSNGIEAITTRRAEEAAALGPVTRRHWWLPNLEMQYAQNSDPVGAARTIQESVTRWVANNSAPGMPCVVAVPAGAGALFDRGLLRQSAKGSVGRGGPAFAWLRELKHKLYVRRKHAAQAEFGALQHPDHVLVRDCVLDSLLGVMDAVVLLYEDLPYLWSVRAEKEVAAICGRRGLQVEALELPINRERKCAALAHYASQLRALDPIERRLETPSGLPATERYWTINRSTSDQ